MVVVEDGAVKDQYDLVSQYAPKELGVFGGARVEQVRRDAGLAPQGGLVLSAFRGSTLPKAVKLMASPGIKRDRPLTPKRKTIMRNLAAKVKLCCAIRRALG